MRVRGEPDVPFAFAQLRGLVSWLGRFDDGVAPSDRDDARIDSEMVEQAVQVAGIRGYDCVARAGEERHMCVDDVVRGSCAQQRSDQPGCCTGEVNHLASTQHCGEPCLSRTVVPNLGDHTRRRRHGYGPLVGRLEDRERPTVALFRRHKRAGVQDVSGHAVARCWVDAGTQDGVVMRRGDGGAAATARELPGPRRA